MAPTLRREFAGTERFEIVRRLGAGGMGVVYEAIDRDRSARVALKAMLHANTALLYQFKQEFRSLADVVHRNLVGLHELQSVDGKWFFTMELVDGVELLEWVRPIDEDHGGEQDPTVPSTGGDSYEESATLVGDEAISNSSNSIKVVAGRAFDEDRLRSAMIQIAEGLLALHGAGKLHRDIKPSNVLVDKSGRVVVLDFGLVTDLAKADKPAEFVEGTPAYMAPEQAAGRPLTEASDWYGLGALLYTALTGQPPFTGRPATVIRKKVSSDPKPPSELCAGIPRDLEALCVDLLSRNAGQRPSGRDVLDRLGSVPDDLSGPVAIMPRRASSAVIGRHRELAALEDALAKVRTGEPVTVYVPGRSGLGKSTLVDCFLRNVERDNHALVLRGRCYERESVPFKAFDDLVDELSRYLLSMSRPRRLQLLPKRIHLLARIFAVMAEVAKDARHASNGGVMEDAQELRRRGFAALRELLTTLAKQRPLVLFIDDLHWGDIDSAPLFLELIGPPDPPALLLVAAYRAEERHSSALLAHLFDETVGLRTAVDVREVPLEPLSDRDAAALVTSLSDDQEITIRAHADKIAKEARGVPLFVQEMVQHMRERSDQVLAADSISFSDMIRWRVEGLPASARRLLEAVAVAGRPISEALASHVGMIAADDHTPLATLRAATMVRTNMDGDRREVESYHDQIRENVVANLDHQRLRDIHRAFGEAIEASSDPDPLVLTEHFRHAGLTDRAAAYAELAADRAASNLAFERAAALYLGVLEVQPEHPNQLRLRSARAMALENAGRMSAAATAHIEAAQYAEQSTKLHMYRRAAELWMITGHVHEGREAFREVVQALGLHWPTSAASAIANFAYNRAIAAMSPINEAPPDGVTAQERARADVCYSAARSLGSLDFIRGLEFLSLHKRLANKIGDPAHVARAAILEITLQAVSGGPDRRALDKAMAEANARAEKVDDVEVAQLLVSNSGLAEFFLGRWRVGLAGFSKAIEYIGATDAPGTRTEVSRNQVFVLQSHLMLGELAQMNRKIFPWLKAASESGDLWGACSMRVGLAPYTHLCADDPNAAMSEAKGALEAWRHDIVEFVRLWHYGSMIDLRLYTADLEDSHAYHQTHWPRIKRGPLLRCQWERIRQFDRNARAAIAAAKAGKGDAIGLAKKNARWIAGQKMQWGTALSHTLRAQIAHLAGDADGALAALDAAMHDAAATESGLVEQAAKRAKGLLIGGDEGAALIAEVDAHLGEQGVRAPAKLCRVYTPGFGEA